MHNAHMNNLAMFRDLRGLTQAELADMIGVNQSTIQRAEAEHPSAKLETYKLCAQFLNVTLAQIFGPARSELEMELFSALSRVPKHRYQDVLSLLRLATSQPLEEAE